MDGDSETGNLGTGVDNLVDERKIYWDLALSLADLLPRSARPQLQPARIKYGQSYLLI